MADVAGHVLAPHSGQPTQRKPVQSRRSGGRQQRAPCRVSLRPESLHLEPRLLSRDGGQHASTSGRASHAFQHPGQPQTRMERGIEAWVARQLRSDVFGFQSLQEAPADASRSGRDPRADGFEQLSLHHIDLQPKPRRNEAQERNAEQTPYGQFLRPKSSLSSDAARQLVDGEPRKHAARNGDASDMPLARMKPKRKTDMELMRVAKRVVDCAKYGHITPALSKVSLTGREMMRLFAYLTAEQAVAAFQYMKTQERFSTKDPFLYSRLMALFNRQPGAAPSVHALQVFDDMKADGVAPDIMCFNIAITAAGKASQWERALLLMAEMRSAGLAPDVFTYSSLLSACASCRRWQEALTFFEQMEEEGVPPNVVTYTTLVSLCARAGQWQEAMRIFRRMEAAGVRGDAMAYNSAITACAKGGAWQTAWAVFSGMRRAGVAPTTVSYNALISACERCSEPDRALEVFHRMERALEDWEERNQQQNSTARSMQHDVNLTSSNSHATSTSSSADHATHGGHAKHSISARSTAVAAIEDALQPDSRSVHGSSMPILPTPLPDPKPPAPNAVTYNTLISACAKAGRCREAFELHAKMRRSNVPDDTFTLSALISACDRGGDWRRALDVVADFRARGIRSNTYTYNALINCLGTGAQWEQALDVFHAMHDDPRAHADVVTYASLISALERCGQWREALDAYESLKEAGLRPNGYIFAPLINACEKGGQWKKAIELFKTMQELDVNVDSVSMVARRVVYAFPSLVSVMPAPLILSAARAVVDSGRAARHWIDKR